MRLKVKGLEKFVTKLQGLKQNVKNPDQFLSFVGNRGLKEIDSHFRQSQGKNGKWKPLKVRKGKPLMDTGFLRARIFWKKISESVIQFIANANYGIFHQEGRKKIPQRKFLWFPEGFQKEMLKKWEKYVNK
jgi:phage gpG-like protein